MFTERYWNERAKKSGNSLRTVMKRSLPDIMNRYFDKEQKKVISSMVGSNNLLLEVGCGFGRLIRSLEESNNCIGADFSKEMLVHAKNNLKSQLVLAYGNKLPFKKNSFDRVLCVTVLIHILTFEEIKQVLNEIDFVLRDGGILVIGEMGYFSFLVQKLLLKLGIAEHAMALSPFKLSDTIEGMGYSIINTIKCGAYPNDVYFIAAKK